MECHQSFWWEWILGAKQVKEKPPNRFFDDLASGKPTSFIEEIKLDKEKVLKSNARQYISIRDQTLWEQIEQLLPYYTTFNKLVNDALQYGVPALLEAKTKPITYEEVKPEQPQEKQPIYEAALDPRIDELIRLQQEIIMYLTLQKYMLDGLYNIKAMELKGGYAERFEKGYYNYTPDCLFAKEVDMLKELGGNRDE